MATPKLLVDLSILVPEPRGVIRWGNPPVDYPVIALGDLPYKKMIAVLQIAEEAQAGNLTMPELADRIRQQLAVLVPDLPESEMETMTYSTMLRFLRAAQSADPDVAAAAAAEGRPAEGRPLEAVAAGALSSDSPPPPDDSAGPTTS